MSSTHHLGVENDLGDAIAALVTDQQPTRLPPHYRPRIGMLASPATLAQGQRRVMGADLASIEALLRAGGEVRLIPIRLPQQAEDPFELVLDAVLAFDGLLLCTSTSDVDPHWDGHDRHAQLSRPDSMVDWWTMLMALVARQTLTPLFGIAGGAARITVAFGGTLHQQLVGHRVEEHSTSENRIVHVLDMDPDKLARCVRGTILSTPAEYIPSHPLRVEMCCLHQQVPQRLAPGFLAWGWSTGITAGFGYPGPAPWFALGTLFHAEITTGDAGLLSDYLFDAFLTACRAYAASLRDELKSARLHDRMLRRLYADARAQRFLQGPLSLDVESVHSSRERKG